MDVSPPTSSLPLLGNISACTLSSVTAGLINLRALYWPRTPLHSPLHRSKLHMHDPVRDSGYASAEDDFENEMNDEDESTTLLKMDPLERTFALRWLTGFIARSEEWIDAAPLSVKDLDYNQLEIAKERDNRIRIVEEAAALLALSAKMQTDGALVRQFRFVMQGGESMAVELRDQSCEHDHESVGLHTWGSAHVLAKMICAEPEKYLPLDSAPASDVEGRRYTVRVLELGAGTGLLSMVVAKLSLQRDWGQRLEVVATDYHSAVLENLRSNVARNFGRDAHVVRVDKLDWSKVSVLEERDKFDVIFAADVIYEKRHVGWIRSCAENLLRRDKERVMWLIVPRRPTRMPEIESVNDVFTATVGLSAPGILQVEDIDRCSSVGRADEDGYRLFKIGWSK